MTNIWVDFAAMKRDFPINSKILINEDVEEAYWGEEVGGQVAMVFGYGIAMPIPEVGMLQVVTAIGKEYAIFPDECELYFESQVC